MKSPLLSSPITLLLSASAVFILTSCDKPSPVDCKGGEVYSYVAGECVPGGTSGNDVAPEDETKEPDCQDGDVYQPSTGECVDGDDHP